MKNFDLTQLTNEELIDLQNKISFEKRNRAKLIDTFEKVWSDIEKAGIKIWFTGNEYTTEKDFQLKLNEIYFN